MKKLLTVAVLLFILSAVAFGNVVLKVKGTVKYDKLPVNDVQVILYKNGVQESTSITINGKFAADLEKDSKYKIVLSKKGFYTQYINIDTKMYGGAGESWSYRCVVDLLPEVNAINGDIFNESLWNIKYDKDIEKFDNESVPELVERLKYFLEKYETAKQQAYNNMIKNADEAFNNKDYQLAAKLYNNAVILNSEYTYPDEQLSRIRKLALN